MEATACPAPGLLNAAARSSLPNLPDFTTEAFRRNYLEPRADGKASVSLLLDGIRCAGCSHTVEKVLQSHPGVLEAELNYSTHRTKLVWDEDQTRLDHIIEAVRDAGYDARPQPLVVPGLDQEEVQTRERFPRLMLAIFGAMNLMWIAIAQYAGYFSGMEQRHEDLLNLASFALATPVLFYSGLPFFQGAWRDLKLGALGMDFQVAFSTTVIYLYSTYAALAQSGSTYFEAVAMFIAFLSIGKYLEQLGIRKILNQGRAFQNLMPFSVTRVDGDQRLEATLEDIAPGWVLEVQPGERVAADGEVLSGEALVDESHLTGEPLPVSKQPGAPLSSGSICQDGVLQYRVHKAAAESTLARIIRRVEDALSSKPRIRVLADRLARYFVFGITAVAAATFVWVWQTTSSPEQALMNAMAVLIIACPCALSLATPIAVLTGLSVATSKRILFRDGAQFETLRQITDVVLDKTGTITAGTPEVAEVIWQGAPQEALALALASQSRHPVSRTIRKHFESQALEPVSLTQLREVAGRGLQAQWGERTVLGGSLPFLRASGVVFSAEEEAHLQETMTSVGSLFFLAVDQALCGTFIIHDQIRSGSQAAIRHFQELGLQVHLLTGDHPAAAQAVADACQIDPEQVHASASPEDKLAHIRTLQAKGASVLMVGDGLNDAPALAQADLGIAMGASADKALEISDLVLLSNSLESLVSALKISHHAFHLIRQNLGISLIYNLIALPLAIGGWVIPLIAALSMSLSSLLVVLNSLRSRRTLKPA